MLENIKIVTVVGARPQFVKAAVVSRAIAAFNSSQITTYQNASYLLSDHQQPATTNNPLITEIIIHTGQHYDPNMSDVFFKEMQIPEPAYNLKINGLNHGAMTGQMLEKIEDILVKEKPDLVLVYGDTNSTLAGALAAKKLHIKVAHVEAGLRSFNMNMPEEINRILTDKISDMLFCPTETAVKNLKNEGFFCELPSQNHQPLVVNVGDVMYDAALFYEKYSRSPEFIKLNTQNSTPKTNHNFILATLHRAENTDDETRLRNILEAFNEISKEISLVLPLHPRTKKILLNSKLEIKNLNLIEPVSYFEMIWLLKHCKIVMTDSGGLQKEAFFFKKPCITLREETEWIELVENGFNLVAGYKKEDIFRAYHNTKQLEFDFSKILYGTGNAGGKIVDYIINSILDKDI